MLESINQPPKPLAASRREQWMATRWFGWALAVSATLAVSIVPPVVRGVVVQGMDPTTLLVLRLSATVVLMAGTLAITAPERLTIDRRGFRMVALIGVLSGIEMACFFWSLRWLDASMAAMIKSTQPLFVLGLLLLGGERLTRRHLVRLVLAIAGIYLLIGPGGQVAPIGFLLLLISNILYAMQLVFTQWFMHTYDTRTVTLYILVMMTLVVGGWWVLQGAHWQSPDLAGWLAIAALVLVSTYFARLALYSAVHRVGSDQVALLWPLQTLGAIVLSVLFLNEWLTFVQWLGGGLILISAMMANDRFRALWRRRKDGFF